MLPTGLVLALGAMLCWGVWTLFATLATRSLALEAAVVVSYATGAGAVAFYAGLAEGDSAVVTTASGLYLVLAALLGVAVLGEPPALRDVAGIGFAVLAIALLATCIAAWHPS